MEINNYLKEKQPILYKTFLNALNKQEIAHAYLLVGQTGTPLLEIAKFLAKTLLCEKPNPLACNKCLTCQRVDNDNYADLIIIDNAKDIISKSDISRITTTFSRTSIDKNGKSIYIINKIEKANPSALNSLLKFLEEPGPNIYAFITTENESRILPTIISRTQRITIKQIDRANIILDTMNSGVSLKDAELLSSLFQNAEEIKKYSNSDEYKTVLNMFDIIVENLKNRYDLLFTIENKLNRKDLKQYMLTLLRMLSDFFTELVRQMNGEKIFLTTYDKIIKDLSLSLTHIENSLLEIMNVKEQLRLNVNSVSILEHLAIFITREPQK